MSKRSKPAPEYRVALPRPCERLSADNARLPYLQIRASLYRGGWKPAPIGTVTVGDIIRLLQRDEGRRGELIRAIRRDATLLAALLADGVDKKDPRARIVDQRLGDTKGRLAAVTIGGAFAYQRGREERYTPTGLTIVDIDKLEPAMAAELRQKGEGLPGCRTAFISPSGRGVKYVVALERVPSTAEEHDAATREVMRAFRVLLQQEVDPSGCDVSRLCYLSVDPDTAVWVDKDPFRWSGRIGEPTDKASGTAAAKPRLQSGEGYEEGGRNNRLYVRCVRAQSVDSLVAAVIEAGASGLMDPEIWRTVRSALTARVRTMRNRR